MEVIVRFRDLEIKDLSDKVSNCRGKLWVPFFQINISFFHDSLFFTCIYVSLSCFACHIHCILSLLLKKIVSAVWSGDGKEKKERNGGQWMTLTDKHPVSLSGLFCIMWLTPVDWFDTCLSLFWGIPDEETRMLIILLSNFFKKKINLLGNLHEFPVSLPLLKIIGLMHHSWHVSFSFSCLTHTAINLP